jgi:glycosyltransferase involved in cell wall biosynthesis
MKKVLWIYTGRSSFVEKDIRLMQDYFEIDEFHIKHDAFIITVFSFIRLFFHLVFVRYDLMVCQFAGYQSFIPSVFHKIFKRKFLIIVGGTDCASIPEINYGNFNRKILGRVTAFSLKNCSYITAVDETLLFQEYTYDSRISNQGIRYFVPDIKTPMNVIYNGYDSEKWFCNRIKKPNTFITVNTGISALKRKGIDMIFDIADDFPDCLFIIIGLNKRNLPFKEKPNIELHDFVPNNELINYFSSSQFYLQLSLMEGFPNALCEAMLCECIPIVSEVAAMPKIVGDSGFVLKRRDVNELKKLISNALNSDKVTLAKKARKRIQENFTEERRKGELKALMDNIIG